MHNALYNIRRSGMMDIDALEEIEKKCFPYGKFSRSVLIGFLKHPFSVTLVAEDGQIFASEIIMFHRDSIEIASIAVLPERRRMGVARSLLREAEKMGMLRGVSNMTLHVDKVNNGAIGLYTSEGFRIENTVSDYYGNGKDANYMVKDLAPNGSHAAGHERQYRRNSKDIEPRD
ncbi:MAG: GNAT family N-acetyltransferase [Methanomassiliicoccales archaeon]|nr:GNAT family N-acetyltransferase [Methanomassiliicoccales archaeon]